MNDSLREVDPGESAPIGWIKAAQAWAWTVSCVGGVGNLITICAVAYQLYLGRVWRRRHGPAGRPAVTLEGDTLLLLHLSICDFLYCVINLPITATTYNYSVDPTLVRPSKAFCTGAALFRYVNALAEWTTLGLLTVQRCVDLGRSRGARFFRPRPTLLFIAGIWVVSVVLQVGAIAQDVFDYDSVSYKCDMVSLTWKIYFFALESLLPCGLMLTGCCSIIFQIWRNTRKLRAAGMSPELASQRFRSMLRSTALLLMLLFLFLACVIPICVYTVYSLLSPDRFVALGIAIFMFYWIQYGVNFIVYAVSNENYRMAYKQFLMLLVKWVMWLVRAVFSRAWSGQETNKSDSENCQSPTVFPRGGSATSLALFGMYTKGSTHPFHPNSHPAHRHGSYPVPYLYRLKNWSSSRADVEHGGFVLHSLPLWWSTSQSSRSSVITLESTLQHDSGATTPITSTCSTPTTTITLPIFNINTTSTANYPCSTCATSSTTKDTTHTTSSTISPSTIPNTTTTTNTTSSASTTTSKISATITPTTFTTTTVTTTTTTNTKTSCITILTTTTSPITTITTGNVTCCAIATTNL